MLQFMPWRRFSYNEIHKGRFPLWNPYSYGGEPFFANDQSAVLSLYNLLSLPFSFKNGFLVIAILKLIVAGIGMFLLLDLFSLNTFGCLIGSIAWTFSAFMITWLYSTASAAGSLIPWFFYWFEMLLRSIKTNSKYSMILLFGLSLTIGLSFLTGHSETTVNGVIGLSLYAITRILLERRYILRSLFYSGVGLIAGFLIASIQLFPFMQVLLNSEPFIWRSEHLFKSYYLPLSAAILWIIPNISGNQSYWYFYNAIVPHLNEAMLYIGIVPFFLAIYAVGFLRQTYKQTIPLIIMVFISFSFAYGLPVLSSLTNLPLLKSGLSERYIIIMALGLSALAGFGMDGLSKTQNKDEGQNYYYFILITVFVSAITITLYYITREHIEWAFPLVAHILMPRNWFGVQLNPARFGFIFIQIIIALLFIIAAVFLIVKHKTNNKIISLCLLSLSVTDLYIFGIGYNPDPPAAMLNATTPLINKLINLKSSDYTFYASGNILVPNISMNYRLRDFRGFDIIVSMRYQRFLSTMLPPTSLTLGPGGLSQIWLLMPYPVIASLAGIKYIISDISYKPNNHYYKLIGNYQDLSLWENPYAKPLIYLAANVKSVSDVQALELLSTDSPHLLNTTLVTGIDTEGNIDTKKIQILRTKNIAGEHSIAIHSETNGFLVINEPYYPGWHAYINKAEVPMYHTNYLFQGIKLPQGNYTVKIVYRPQLFYIGLAVSLLTVLIMLLIAIIRMLQ